MTGEYVSVSLSLLGAAAMKLDDDFANHLNYFVDLLAEKVSEKVAEKQAEKEVVRQRDGEADGGDEILKLDDAAARYKIETHVLRDACKRGEIGRLKVGKSVRFKVSELEEDMKRLDRTEPKGDEK